PGVDAGLLDVLHDPAEVQLGAVVERVDVDLDRGVQEAVDEDGRLGAAAVGQVASHVVDQARLVEDDLHPAAAQHVARAHQHRVADLCGDLDRVTHPPGGPVRGRGQVRLGQQRTEVAAVLGVVDRGGAGADDRQAGGLEAAGEGQRGLAAQLDDDAGDR